MTDYYDGPRRGIADFRGRPHAYHAEFDDRVDGATDVFELRAIDDATLRLALEDWEIWLRWRDAYELGTTAIESHPALPVDRARHDAIALVLEARLGALPDPVVRARGEFRPREGHATGGQGRWLEVEWTPE